MGVAGSGKSTVGRLLADRLGLEFAEADDFHPPANINRMRSGVALDEAARQPWLRAIARWIAGRRRYGTGGVVTCSALKRRYRDLLREGDLPDDTPLSEIWFVYLATDPEVVADRIERRPAHFMPADLLPSQYADLEPLEPGEPGIAVDAGGRAAEVAEAALRRLRTAGATLPPLRGPSR
ncbi:gluconokinase [Allonocardiopsis opalescens]|nr:gluconokinase [Allonocardiopsis opalescens]